VRRSALGLFSLALALSGCASIHTPEQDLAKLQGQPIQAVIAKLGTPDFEQIATGGTTYGWFAETRVDVPTKTTTTEYSSGRPNTVETVSYLRQTQTCMLRLAADAAGIIAAFEWQGSNEACSPLFRKLAGQS
jgi:hypothetical protein